MSTTLLRVWVVSIYEKNYISTLPTLPILKRSKISPKISPTLPRVWIFSIYKKNYISTLPSLPWKKIHIWTLPTLLCIWCLIINRNMYQLCQLCFFITTFENMSTLPNFAQLCPTMHFSHSHSPMYSIKYTDQQGLFANMRVQNENVCIKKKCEIIKSFSNKCIFLV